MTSLPAPDSPSTVRIDSDRYCSFAMPPPPFHQSACYAPALCAVLSVRRMSASMLSPTFAAATFSASRTR